MLWFFFRMQMFPQENVGEGIVCNDTGIWIQGTTSYLKKTTPPTPHHTPKPYPPPPHAPPPTPPPHPHPHHHHHHPHHHHHHPTTPPHPTNPTPTTHPRIKIVQNVDGNFKCNVVKCKLVSFDLKSVPCDVIVLISLDNGLAPNRQQSHYLNQWWTSSMTHISGIVGRWVNTQRRCFDINLQLIAK